MTGGTGAGADSSSFDFLFAFGKTFLLRIGLRIGLGKINCGTDCFENIIECREERRTLA
jgi:hypothetical protein